MKIAISINGILRDLLGKIKKVHKKYYDSDVEEDLNYDNIKELLNFKDQDELLEFFCDIPLINFLDFLIFTREFKSKKLFE